VDYATVIPEFTWRPRHGWPERTTLGWSAELGPFRAFAAQVTASELLPVLGQIVAVRAGLAAQYMDGGLYFPITRYGMDRPADKQEVRATEAYLAKFPVELFDVIPGIGSAHIDETLDRVEDDLPEDFQPVGKKAPSGRTTRAVDPDLRKAVERRSLDVVMGYYLSELGGTDYEEVGKPYDIKIMVAGEACRCEVKGSTMEIDAVELTYNEVEHAAVFTPIDLIVVDRIVPITDSNTGKVIDASGGRRRVWLDWTPAQSDLRVTKYAYRLRAGSI
jgi:hypothetical protein